VSVPKGGHLSFRSAKAALARGENITMHLREQLKVDRNTPEIIEIAYDLQAGTYVEWVNQHREFSERFTAEMASILNAQCRAGDALLDVGTGELTTLSCVANKLTADLSGLFALDISWSRLRSGLAFADETLAPSLLPKLQAFTADMAEVPLLSKSMDVTISYHALEPNGGKEQALLTELFRVTRRKLILFEPSYERNTSEGRERMDRLGYIRNLDGHARELGGKVEDIIMLQHIDNPANPTFAYVITPPMSTEEPRTKNASPFSDPGTNDALVKFDSCYFSPERGVAYPIIEGIPVLRVGAAVLTSALDRVAR
jgi:uncharacterized protein YbaR (Trm112 family)/ubiquinone/menaquinone biosynthesis C-methylase UbiE